MKYIKTALFMVFFLSFLFIANIDAQDTTNPQGITDQGPAFVCLDTTWCKDNNQCSVANIHRTRVSTSQSKGAPNSVAYVAECLDNIPGKNGPVCTTGNSEIDKMLFCAEADRNTNPECDRYKFLQDTIGYSITQDHKGKENSGYGYYWLENGQMVKKVPPQALRTNGLGDIVPSIIEIQSSTPN
ncbi:MAG TPA: hypothetical protein PLS49_07030, partial [Candidatus Woesebacteria bacterium]|nr:hypothetical protein [Candidatus Woesebacteria bacterium]